MVVAAGSHGSSAKAADGNFSTWGCLKYSNKDHRIADSTEELYRRCSGWVGIADVCFTAKEEAVLAVMSKVGARMDG